MEFLLSPNLSISKIKENPLESDKSTISYDFTPIDSQLDCRKLVEIENSEYIYAYKNNELTDIFLGDDITLNPHAFASCHSLSSVHFSDNVSLDTIPFECFKGTAIREIEIPKSVKYLDNGALAALDLSGVNILGSVETIGIECFYGANITEIKFKSGLKTISERAFMGCDNLEKVFLPITVESIGVNALDSKNLHLIHFGWDLSEEEYNSPELSSHPVPSIPENPFDYYIKLNIDCAIIVPPAMYNNFINDVNWSKYKDNIVSGSVNDSEILLSPSDNSSIKENPTEFTDASGSFDFLSDSLGIHRRNMAIVENAGSLEIRYNKYVTDLYIGSDITLLPQFCFSSCSSLHTVEFSNDSSIAIIPRGIFQHDSNLTDVKLPPSVTELDYQSFDECSSLSSINGIENVTKLDSYCLNGANIDENTFMFPSGLKSLYDYSLGNTKFKNVVLPDTVEVLQGAFAKCTELSSAYIPNNGKIKSVSSLFIGCTSLKTVELPNSITSLSRTFEGCTSLTGVEIPSSVTKLYGYVFRNCTALSSIDIPESIREIDSNGQLFTNCTSLTGVDFPDTIKYFRGGHFAGCTSLKHVKFPKNSRTIPYSSNMFDGCISLTDVILPDNLIEFGSSFFKNCKSLSHIALNPDLVNISSSMFYGCSSLSSISIPSKISNIYYDAFRECTSLTSIGIPMSTKIIYERAFLNDSSLTNIVIGSDLTEDEYNSPEVSELYPIIQLRDSTAFDGLPENYTITVPKSQYDAYVVAPKWSEVSAHIVTSGGNDGEYYEPTYPNYEEHYAQCPYTDGNEKTGHYLSPFMGQWY